MMRATVRGLAWLVLPLLAGLRAPAAERPNVVIIMADDLGWGSVGCYGADPRLVRTPHIDSLARDGRRFTDANTTSSVCSPTRYALLTGRYCWRTPLQSEVLGTTAPLHVEPGRLTIASLLKEQGYRTAAIGKWHLGYGTAEPCDFTRELKPGPLEIGFDHHFGVPANHGDISGVYVEDHWVAGLDRASPAAPSPPYVTQSERKGNAPATLALNAPKRVDDRVMDTLTDRAVAWIATQRPGAPFFLLFTPVAVHNPITPSARTAGTSAGGPFCDFLGDLDHSVGRILDALESRGLARNTLVLFTSDNGGVNKEGGETPQNQARAAGLAPVGPFRGGKHDVWEGGFRVPYLVRWPGRVPAGSVCAETVSVVDTLASLAAITGVPLPAPAVAAEDSHDVSPAWMARSHATPLRPDLIVHSADGNFAIRRDSWKWIEGVPAADVRPASRKARTKQFQPMLFNLGDDVAEVHDLSAAHPDRAAALKSLLERYRDGGYSREVPPVRPPKPPVAPLPPLAGRVLVSLPLDGPPPAPWATAGGPWTPRDGGLWVQAKAAGASLSGPLELGDGALEIDVRLGEADRVSLRIHAVDDARSFRVVLSHGMVDVALNPAPGGSTDHATALARKRFRFDPAQWQTVRLTFSGDELAVQIAGETVRCRDPLFAKPKARMYCIAFDGTVGVRRLTVAAAERATHKPNVVYILCDDLGYGDVRCFNPERCRIATPHIDALAAAGMRFTDAHSGSSVCTPTRYGLLTGRYAWRTRLQRGVLDGGNDEPLIAADRLTVPGLLSAHGYATACIGKWHLGFQSDSAVGASGRDAEYGRGGLPVGARISGGPTTRGCDMFFGCSNARTMSSLIGDDRVVESIAPVEMLPRLAARAVDYIHAQAADARAGKPFFLYLPLTSPHAPIVPSASWQGASGLGDYGDFVMQTDAVVGDVVRAIEAAGLAENTLVFFTADNGCAPQAKVAKLEAAGHAPSAGFRGYKSDIWEGGHRVPFIARWPGRVSPGSECRQTICHGDLIATCAEMLGHTLPANAGEDSASILPLLLGHDVPPIHEAVVHHSIQGRFAIRAGRWKLALCAGSGGWGHPDDAEALRMGLPPVQLYDLESDAAESRNVAADHRDVVQRLGALLDTFVAEGRSTPGPRQRNDVTVSVRPPVGRTNGT